MASYQYFTVATQFHRQRLTVRRNFRNITPKYYHNTPLSPQFDSASMYGWWWWIVVHSRCAAGGWLSMMIVVVSCWVCWKKRGKWAHRKFIFLHRKNVQTFPMPTPFTAKNGVGIRKVCTFFGRRRAFPLELPGPITVPEKEGLVLVSTERTWIYEETRRFINT